MRHVHRQWGLAHLPQVGKQVVFVFCFVLLLFFGFFLISGLNLYNIRNHLYQSLSIFVCLFVLFLFVCCCFFVVVFWCVFVVVVCFILRVGNPFCFSLLNMICRDIVKRVENAHYFKQNIRLLHSR